MSLIKRRIGLLTGAAMALTFPSLVHAQAAPGTKGSDLQPDIIVTATKQSETINRVPLSVSALSQATLDSKSIRDISDLARTVPALNFTPAGVGGAGASSGVIIAIRGIYANAGAATTGIYLDDVPLQKRFAPGQTASGSPLPQLFDLERVEVLRGPQGTLFGGSSEGGAIRFITPAPSLTKFSGQSRAEAYTTKTGDPSGELGLAVGGPIVTDVLGLRVSVLGGRIGGYVDHINPRTQQVIANNTNWETHFATRGALLFEPVAGLKISPSIYLSRRFKNDTDDFWSNYASYSTPAKSFGANGRPASPTNPAVFTRPAVTYPAQTAYGPGKSGELVTSPIHNDLTVSSLDLQYDTGGLSFKSITALTVDETRAHVASSGTLESLLSPQYGGYNILGPDDPVDFAIKNHRRSFSQETRVSNLPGSRLNWVVGGFYQRATNSALVVGHEAIDPQSLTLFGVRSGVRYGVQESAVDPISSFRNEVLIESSLAAFGEATFAVTKRLKLISGLRAADEKFSFNACQYGTLNGTNVCTATNGLLTSGRQKASPVLPKIGVSFQVTNKDLLYFTASKGYRGGGVNSAIPQNAACNAALTALGGSRPDSYAPDYVNSYELGAKLSMFGGRARINASVYRIDWSRIQLSIALSGCLGFAYVDNAGSARSQGGELSVTLNPAEGLTADINLGYTDAKYTQTTLGSPSPTTGARATLVHDGDQLPIAPFTAALGLQYEFRAFGDHALYIRGDGLYTSSFHKTLGPGAVGYDPDVYNQGHTTLVNARLGVKLTRYDISLFVKNLFNSQEITNQSLSNGRTGCADQTCATPTATRYNNYYSTFRPRQIGITTTARF